MTRKSERKLEDLLLQTIQKLSAINEAFAAKATGADLSVPHAKFVLDVLNAIATSSRERPERKPRVSHDTPPEPTSGEPSPWARSLGEFLTQSNCNSPQVK